MDSIELPSKPGATIAYKLHAADNADFTKLVVFANNIMMPATSWTPTIGLVREKAPSLAFLTYDRFGQGATTARDPADARAGRDDGYGHDLLDVAADLHELVAAVVARHGPAGAPRPRLLLVGASIGGPMARFYAQTYPGAVDGLVLVDSNISNADWVSYYPAVESGEVQAWLTAEAARDPPGCTAAQYAEAKAKMHANFRPDLRNREGLDRRTIPGLLPRADGPALESGGGKATKVAVIGHEVERFAQEGLERMGMPASFSQRWTQPPWDEYNRGLLKIGDSSAFPEVLYAPGTGHFIQHDNPGFVADVLVKMLGVLGW